MIKTYKDLEVYQISYKLALIVHQMTEQFPKYETYEIGSQLRRAALSIPLNIAEGYGKKQSAKEFKRFLNMTLGSCNEIYVLLDMIKDLEYIEKDKYEELVKSYEMLGKRIYVLMKRWQ